MVGTRVIYISTLAILTIFWEYTRNRHPPCQYWYFSLAIRAVIHGRKCVAHHNNISDRIMIYLHSPGAFELPRGQVCRENISTGSSGLACD